MTNLRATFRGVPLVPPVECSDPDSWIAQRIYEMGVNDARAALAKPEPQGPTEEELIQLAIDTRLYRFQATAGDPVQYEMSEQQVHAFARAVLARWGNR